MCVSMNPGSTVEVDTPNGSAVITQPGDYRFDAFPDNGGSDAVVTQVEFAQPLQVRRGKEGEDFGSPQAIAGKVQSFQSRQQGAAGNWLDQGSGGAESKPPQERSQLEEPLTLSKNVTRLEGDADDEAALEFPTGGQAGQLAAPGPLVRRQEGLRACLQCGTMRRIPRHLRQLKL